MFDISKNICAIIVAAIFTIYAAPATAQVQPSFDTQGTVLVGKFYGSYVMLGSGEMLKGSILQLEELITIAGNEESGDRRNRKPAKNVGVILLEFEGEEPADEMFGGTAQVTGRLINEPSDPFHTKVRMLVEDITLIEAAIAGQPVATFKTH